MSVCYAFPLFIFFCALDVIAGVDKVSWAGWDTKKQLGALKFKFEGEKFIRECEQARKAALRTTVPSKEF